MNPTGLPLILHLADVRVRKARLASMRQIGGVRQVPEIAVIRLQRNTC